MDRKGDGVLRYVHNRRRRTRKGPEPACVLSPQLLGWHMQGEKDECHRMPSGPLRFVIVPGSRVPQTMGRELRHFAASRRCS